jgi:prepilin-type N-terminal cleavage/methylation domain-containing protein
MTTDVDAHRPGRPGGGADGGFSLVEVMVAVVLLLIVLGGMLNAMVGAIGSVRGSRDRQQAVALANEVLERARGLPVANLALRTSDAPPAAADPDGPGPMGNEAAVATPTGLVTGPPFRRDADGFSTRTIVTWYDDPLRPGSQNTRRVTATVTWTASGGRVETVRLSTLVSALARGVT